MDVLGQQYLVKMFLRPHLWLLGAKHFQTVYTQPRYTGSSTTSGGGEADTQQPAATDEDAPKCEKSGWHFHGTNLSCAGSTSVSQLK